MNIKRIVALLCLQMMLSIAAFAARIAWSYITTPINQNKWQIHQRGHPTQ